MDQIELFGPYRLEELLGEGGMGEVYRAFDTRRQRTVALKRLRPGLAADAEYQERFRRESRLAARLSSPHVIPIHDFGEIDGRLFIDMRLVVGADLARQLQQNGPLPAARAVEIVRQVADALDSAHDDGLVHRDVKPSNVLITGYRDRDFAYLVDFGIVRAVGGDTKSSLTGTGSAVGTMAYMAPEVFTSGRVDRGVDVYSLGCMFYEVLTGQPPFIADGPALMFQHLSAEPPRPTARHPELPTGFDAVVARAMAKDPSQRYSTAGQLADAAQQALAGGLWSPLPAPPPPPPTPPPTPQGGGGSLPLPPPYHPRGSSGTPVPQTYVGSGPFLPPGPPSAPQPVRPARRTGLFVGLAAIAVVVVVLVSLGLYAASRNGPTPPPPTASPTSTSTPTTTLLPPGEVAMGTDGHFAVTVPDGWSSRTPQFLLELRAADNGTNVIVSAEPISSDSLDDLAKAYVQDIATSLGATIDSGGIESATVAGLPARRYSYTIPESSTRRATRGRQVVTRHGGFNYIITYSAIPESFNTYVADYESVVSSWRWLD